MTEYFFKGKTQQKDSDHQNKVIAIKVDQNDPNPFTMLAESTADANGDFILKWNDWAGRVVIGAVDDDETEKLQCVFHDFFVGIESTDINITQAPVVVVMEPDGERGIRITQAPIFVNINNINNRGVSVTQAPVYVMRRILYNLTAQPSQTTVFNLIKEV